MAELSIEEQRQKAADIAGCNLNEVSQRPYSRDEFSRNIFMTKTITVAIDPLQREYLISTQNGVDGMCVILTLEGDAVKIELFEYLKYLNDSTSKMYEPLKKAIAKLIAAKKIKTEIENLEKKLEARKKEYFAIGNLMDGFIGGSMAGEKILLQFNETALNKEVIRVGLTKTGKLTRVGSGMTQKEYEKKYEAWINA